MLEIAAQLKILHAVQLFGQILLASMISSFQSFIFYSYLILDKAQATELIVVAYNNSHKYIKP